MLLRELCASLLGLDRSDAGAEVNQDNAASHISDLISPCLNMAKDTGMSADGMKQLRDNLPPRLKPRFGAVV